MNDAWFYARSTADFPFNQTHATHAAMSGAAIVRKIYAIGKSRIEQKVATATRKTFAIDRNLVASTHSLPSKEILPAILADFGQVHRLTHKILSGTPILSWRN
jgi:hypothetical protein